MAMRTKLCFTLFLVSVLVLCAGLALAKKDPELKQCKHQCEVQQQYDDKQKKQCKKDCEDYYKEKKHEREKGGGGGSGNALNVDEPERRLRDCQVKCDERHDEGGQQWQTCRITCQKKYENDEQGSEHNHHRREKEEDQGRQEEEEEEEAENPYVFEDDYFLSKVKTTHGSIYAIPKFSSLSKLLRGIRKYRLGSLEVNTQTFLTPTHLDADGVFFVSSGQGTVTVIHRDKRQSFNIRKGVLLRIPAGTTFYVVNNHQKEKMFIVQLLQSVNNAGQYEPFFWGAGSNPESFFSTFSSEILEAAFKTSSEEVQKLFKRREQGVFVKASKEQIKALSGTSEEGGGIWPFGSRSKGTFELFKQSPTQSNKFGKLYEVDYNDYPPLEDIDLAISYANISRGAMIAPYYNSESTKISYVVDGDGYVEIACPHASSSKSSEQYQEVGSRSGSTIGSRVSYQKMRSPITSGTVFVVPAGHPVAIVSSNRGNLEILCFELNAKNNYRYTLAGRKNVVKLMEREAKELTFNAKGEDVDRVFGKQDEEFFVQGPNWRQQPEQGRAYE
ncbi:hypothetical protein ACOSP7_001480 [Xanthoceras sorbifolium]